MAAILIIAKAVHHHTRVILHQFRDTNAQPLFPKAGAVTLYLATPIAKRGVVAVPL